VTATAADTAGNPCSATMQIIVYPQIHAAATVTPSTTDPQTVTFTASASGGDGHYLAYQWSFSDGTTASGRVVKHAFPAGISPSATLTVTDGTGARASVAA
jgi:chitodextrinase